MLEPPIQREVYTLTTWSAQPADGDGEANGADGAPAPAKKKRGKAELRAQLEGETDPYRLLELEELRWRATQDDVRKAYRRLVLLHHPDKQDAAKAKAERAEAAAAKARDADGDGDDDDDGGVPTTLPAWQVPRGYHAQGSNIPFGESLTLI